MNHMQYTRVYAPVDLDAIAFNMESMRKNIDQKTGMIGVIKTDAYGHGSVPVAEAIEDYVDGYAVATADEAVLLRRKQRVLRRIFRGLAAGGITEFAVVFIQQFLHRQTQNTT